jgi:hypothetical protein
VPQKAVGLPPISKFNWYFLVNYSQGAVKMLKKQEGVPRIKNGYETLLLGGTGAGVDKVSNKLFSLFSKVNKVKSLF